jgi:hypothetical protein
MKKLVFAFFIFSIPALAQTHEYPKNYFRSPVDIPIALSGNFGELRPDHFHTGIDITTHGVEGLPVKAAADGYVSRIKISPWGYGRAIYVTHPNGFTTVYGHTSAYNDAITAYVKTNQYANESFEIELVFTPEQFPVKKGDVIAYSGNTGSSGGPHVHFEIRDTKTEEAINPLLFGMPVKDNVAPTLVTLVVCPENPSSVVNGSNGIAKFSLLKSASGYTFENPKDSIVIYGKVGFAIEAYDKETNTAGKNGVYGIKLECDKKLIYASHLERMSFDLSRYINCFIDYSEMNEHNRFYMRSFVVPNNQLQIYDSLVDDGYCYFKNDGVHKFSYSVSDAYGNSSSLNFKVYSKAKQPAYTDVVRQLTPFSMILMWDTTNTIDESTFRLETPSGAVYNNTTFTYGLTPVKGKELSPRIFMDENIPLQKPCSLTVYANVRESMQSKAVISIINSKGSRSFVGGNWSGKGVTAEIKEFGTFQVVVDSLPPKITPNNFDLKGTDQASLASLEVLKFTISDNFSGIKTYRATIDGKWVLIQYEPKKKLIWYTFDEHCGTGNHELVLEVTDKVGNSAVYKKTFSR